VVYGTKAFPNAAIMRLLAEEGFGADVSTLGELRLAQRAGVSGDGLVVRGKN
jgi:diaminopimelate decarboxylase